MLIGTNAKKLFYVFFILATVFSFLAFFHILNIFYLNKTFTNV